MTTESSAPAGIGHHAHEREILRLRHALEVVEFELTQTLAHPYGVSAEAVQESLTAARTALAAPSVLGSLVGDTGP